MKNIVWEDETPMVEFIWWLRPPEPPGGNDPIARMFSKGFETINYFRFVMAFYLLNLLKPKKLLDFLDGFFNIWWKRLTYFDLLCPFICTCVCFFACLKIRGEKIKSMGSLLITYNDHQNIPFHRCCSDISDAVHTVTRDSHAVPSFSQSQVVSFRTPSVTLMVFRLQK